MVTATDFRRLALALPDTVEGAHMEHADFRAFGRVFASLPRDGQGMVRVDAATQRDLVQQRPEVFTPANGAWGRQGCTYVLLAAVDRAQLRVALTTAWQFAQAATAKGPVRRAPRAAPARAAGKRRARG